MLTLALGLLALFGFCGKLQSANAFTVLDPSEPYSNTTIRIGLVGSKYINNVDRPPLGRDANRNLFYSMQLWLRHLANTTNLLPNASVQLIDNSYDVTISSALVNTLALLDMRVIGLIGAGSSAATKQTSILSNSRFVPQCDGASSSPDLSVKDDYPRFFRTLPNDNLQALAIYDFVVSMGWRRLAIISDSEPYGAGLLRAFEDIAYRSSDVQVVLLQSFASETIGNSSGWIPMFQKIRDVNAFIILIFAVQERVPTLLETAKKEGMLDGDKYAWIGSDAMLRPQSLVAPGLITVFPTNGTGYASAVYQSIWKERSGDINTTSKALSLYAPYFAGCLELFVRGFDRYLATTPNTNMADLAAGKYNERFPSPAVMFNFPEVYAPMGRISLDPETGDPSSSYDIFNVQTVGGTAKFVRVGTWLAMARSILIDSPIYYGSEASTTKPADDINLADYTTIIPMNSALGQTAIILNLLAMVLIAFAIAFFVAKGDETLLRKSSIPSMLAVLVGLFIACFDVFTMTGEPSKTKCVADVWVVGVGTSLVLSAIAIKLLRLYRIFNGIKAGIKGISNSDIIVQTGGPVAVTVCLLIIWTVVDPPQPKLIQESALSYYHVCASAGPTIQTIMSMILIAWNCVLLIICTSLAVATRDIRADFNEAKLVGMCVYNQFLVGVLAIPLLLTGVGSVSITTLFLIKQVAIVITVYCTLGVIHGSKIFIYMTTSHNTGRKTKHANITHHGQQHQTMRHGPGVDPNRPAIRQSASIRVSDDSDDLSDTDDSQERLSNPLLQKANHRIYVTYKEPGVASLWISAEFFHVYCLDAVMLKRTKLHISRTGSERASQRATQLFFNGPQLFLRDIRRINMSLDGKDDRIVHVYTDKDLILSIKFEDPLMASDFQALGKGGTARNTVIHPRACGIGHSSGLFSRSNGGGGGGGSGNSNGNGHGNGNGGEQTSTNGYGGGAGRINMSTVGTGSIAGNGTNSSNMQGGAGNQHSATSYSMSGNGTRDTVSLLIGSPGSLRNDPGQVVGSHGTLHGSQPSNLGMSRFTDIEELSCFSDS